MPAVAPLKSLQRYEHAWHTTSERIRPRTLDEFRGQHHLLDEDGVLQGWFNKEIYPAS